MRAILALRAQRVEWRDAIAEIMQGSAGRTGEERAGGSLAVGFAGGKGRDPFSAFALHLVKAILAATNFCVSRAIFLIPPVAPQFRGSHPQRMGPRMLCAPLPAPLQPAAPAPPAGMSRCGGFAFLTYSV